MWTPRLLLLGMEDGLAIVEKSLGELTKLATVLVYDPAILLFGICSKASIAFGPVLVREYV